MIISQELISFCYNGSLFAQAKKQLKQLDNTHNEHTKDTKGLSDNLEYILDKLDHVKKKMDGKTSSMVDATPLVEM